MTHEICAEKIKAENASLRRLMAENVVIEVVEDDEQGRELLGGIVAVTDARNAAEARADALAERAKVLEAALKGILPGKLCGESWGLPDTETIPIQTTLGALAEARRALTATGGTTDGNR